MSQSSHLPHPNCYRIPGSRVIAGEYPFHPERAQGLARLGAMLEAGITFFVDLTESTESLAPYEALLREESARHGVDVSYRRLPIVDCDIPAPQRMAEILECIAAAEEAGHTVYVHCWGGAGRTGTVTGCYLVRGGKGAEEALTEVNALFQTMSPEKVRKHRHTGSPQTEPQREFVRQWTENDPGPPRLNFTEVRAERLVDALLAEHGSAIAAIHAIEEKEAREAREFTGMERLSGPLGAQAAREEAKRRLGRLAVKEVAAPAEHGGPAGNPPAAGAAPAHPVGAAGSGADGGEAARRDRLRGALIGLAVGDALGTTLEFRSPGTFTPIDDMVGGGPFRLQPGEWTDDTSMALCLAGSLVDCRGFDADDQMQRYLRWYRQGYLSVKGHCFDIGGTTRAALERFERSGDPFAGGSDRYDAGNGSIMRLAPLAIYFADDPAEALRLSAESSRTTHGAQAALDACRYLTAVLLGAFAGVDREELLSPFYSPVPGYWEAHPLVPEVAEVAGGSFRRREPPEIQGSGYSVRSLEAALWAFDRTADFRSGALHAVNLGDDADTTGAVFGQIAGAFYGEQAIPAGWRERLAMADLIDGLAGALADGSNGRPMTG